MQTDTNNSTFLIVEDSDVDFEATMRALRKSGLANRILRREDGDAALDYLFQRDTESEAAASWPPGVILLDLNLPGTDGREVLRAVKSDERLKVIPVIVFTTSLDERDIEACYQAGANSYIQKPVGMNGFFEALQRLKDYWFEVVVMPRA
jgi:CheY-like chemotaxis protein